VKTTGIQPEVCPVGYHLIPWDYSRGCIANTPVDCTPGSVWTPTPANYYSCTEVAKTVQEAPQPLPTLDGWGLLITVCAVALAGVWRATQ